jgi:DNA-binding response OmpR family regulator
MKKIAIIEDDQTILEMYKLKFETAGYQVFTATNGAEGLTVLNGTKIDIILLDLMMPDMDGATMLGELRKTPWGKKIPVIIMTNISRDEMPKSLKNLEVSDYVIKAGTTPQLVLKKVEQTLQNNK